MPGTGCIFCEGAGSARIAREGGYDARRCDGCGLIFVSPRPSPDAAVSRYRDGLSVIAPEDHAAGAMNPAARALARRQLLMLKRWMPPSAAVLEYGPGGGAFLLEAQRRGFRVCGIEPNPAQAAFIREQLGIRCVSSAAEVSGASDGSVFNLIFHRNVLSHFADPVREFGSMARLLANDGVLAFETGNLGDVESRYMGLVASLQIPDHLFFFGQRSLAQLLKRSGFEPILIRRWSLVPLLRLKRALGRKASAGSGAAAGVCRGRPSRAVALSSWLADYWIPYRLGALAPKEHRPQTVFVIARKTAGAPLHEPERPC